MTTLRGIAARAGVSISTASRALAGHPHVAPETRAKVQRVADAQGYIPNTMARGLRRNPTRTVGLVMPDMRNSSFSSEGAIRLQRRLQEFGYGLVLYVTRLDAEIEHQCLKRLQTQQVDGVIHVPVSATSAEMLLDGPVRIPVVEFLRPSGSDRIDGVIHSDEDAAAMVMDHLIKLGHTSIGVIAGPADRGATTRRLAGAARSVREAGLPASSLIIRTGPSSPESGRQGFASLMDRHHPPTAIFATGTQFVLGVSLAARERGIRFPDDVSLAGFGDPDWMQLVSPALTTYALPMEEMAMMAALLMVSRIERDSMIEADPVRIMMSGNLFVRESTAPPR